MLQLDIKTSQNIPTPIYDQDGLGENKIGKVHCLPLSYRMFGTARPSIAVWVRNYQTDKTNFFYISAHQSKSRLASIDGQIEVFTGVADIWIDGFLIRGLKEPRNYKKFPVKGSKQLPLDVIKTTLG